MTTMTCVRCRPDGIALVPADTINDHLWQVHGIHGLRFGYTLDDLQRIARRAAINTRALAGDFHDRYQEAFSATAEALYAAEHWLPEHDLFYAAQNILLHYANKSRNFYGRAWIDGWGYGGLASAPRFAQYWGGFAQTVPSHESRVVERMAVTQILPALSPRQRQVIDALAVTDGDLDAAAKLLGLSYSLVTVHAANARRAAAALWLEGETPVRRYRAWVAPSKRPRGELRPCGTVAAYARHRKRKETPCDACREANRQYGKPYKLAHRKRQSAERP